RAGEIEADALAFHIYSQADRNILFRHAVVVHHVLEGVAAVGNAGDRLAHALRGALDDLVGRLHYRVAAVSGDDFAQTPLAEPASRDLREVIAAALLRHTHVEQDEIEQILLELSFAEETHHRQPQPFMEDLGH